MMTGISVCLEWEPTQIGLFENYITANAAFSVVMAYWVIYIISKWKIRWMSSSSSIFILLENKYIVVFFNYKVHNKRDNLDFAIVNFPFMETDDANLRGSRWN